jgi:hypothetical protein
MAEYQRDWIRGFMPEYNSEETLAKFMRDLGDIPTAAKQQAALHRHKSTPVFLASATEIAVMSRMDERFLDWMDSLPSLESICRASRKSNEEEDEEPSRNGNGRPRSSGSPKWYQRYLKSSHMTELRIRAKEYYGGCVLCDAQDPGLVLHHRHYLTLGSERLRDTCILCADHHNMAWPWLAVRVPQKMPEEVRMMLGG